MTLHHNLPYKGIHTNLLQVCGQLGIFDRLFLGVESSGKEKIIYYE